MCVLSQTVQAYPASGIRRMFDLAAKYDDVVSLCLGEPGFVTPAQIRNAAKKALDQGSTYYTPNAGLSELREAVADRYERDFGLKYSTPNVMITAGATQALYLAMLTTLNPGDEIIVPDPCFPTYLGQAALLRLKTVRVALREENGFKLQAQDLQKVITPQTKAVLLNSPNNPVGSVLAKADLESLAEVALRHNLLVFSDDVYEKIIYDDLPYYCMAQIPEMKERTIVINSFSKTYAMTGWRIGYLLAPGKIVESMPKIQESIVACLPAFVQKAAVAALDGSEVSIRQMVDSYAKKRSILLDGLGDISGLTCQPPQGAFYAFPNIKAYKKTSLEFAKELLEKAGVVTVPGSAFGELGEGYLRLSFAGSEDTLREATRRMRAYVEKQY